MKHSWVKRNAIVVSIVFPGLGKLKLLKHGYVLIDMYIHCRSQREAETVFKVAMTSDECDTPVNGTAFEEIRELDFLEVLFKLNMTDSN